MGNRRYRKWPYKKYREGVQGADEFEKQMISICLDLNTLMNSL